MDFNYTVFNPKTSRVATDILSKQPNELIKRYIKRKSNVPTKFFEIIKKEVNKIDEEEYLINPYLYQMEGGNLDYVAKELFVFASKLKQRGYEFKLDNVASDLDTLFSEYASEVAKMTNSAIVRPISKDVVAFFINEVMEDIVLKTLENRVNKSSSDT